MPKAPAKSEKATLPNSADRPLSRTRYAHLLRDVQALVTTGAARDFVYDRLLSAQTIVVKTERTDIHGRYVTHLFYAPQEVLAGVCFQEGTYLNAELLDANHAVLVV